MTLLYLNSDCLGQGDSDLGKDLMFIFINELANSNIKIDLISCLNSGINLTTTGSEVLNVLKELENKGAKISSCATCLDFYGKRDQLQIGEVGSMKKTVQSLAEADKIIRPN
jgi:selenium metabolism protein YedF